MPRIFISYARKYEAFAHKLATSLSHVGADIWLDITDIPAGMNWSNAIQEGLDAADLMLVVLTPESAASKNVENEWQYYLDESKAVIPILLVPTKVHFQLRRLQYVDFHAQDYDTAFRQLYSELRRQGLQLTPLIAVEGSERIPAQSSLPTLGDKPAVRTRSGLVIGVVAVGVVVALLIIASQSASTPPATPTTLSVAQVATGASTESPISSPDSSGIQSPSTTPCDGETTVTPGATGRPGIDEAITSNGQWTPLVKNFDGVDMVLVPIGSFEMGSRELASGMNPVVRQCFDQPFWIDRTEVTNKQFADRDWRIPSTSNWPGENRPRENVNWFEARRFCEVRGARLPTEKEWEYSARGPDDLNYPWGNDFIADHVAFADNSGGQTADVGSRPGGASWVGAVDMSGNVEEWVSSAYLDYPYRADDGREGSVDSPDVGRVVRGGSWSAVNISLLLAAHRGGYAPPPSSQRVDRGFRCARDFSEADLTS